MKLLNPEFDSYLNEVEEKIQKVRNLLNQELKDFKAPSDIRVRPSSVDKYTGEMKKIIMVFHSAESFLKQAEDYEEVHTRLLLLCAGLLKLKNDIVEAYNYAYQKNNEYHEKHRSEYLSI